VDQTGQGLLRRRALNGNGDLVGALPSELRVGFPGHHVVNAPEFLLMRRRESVIAKEDALFPNAWTRAFRDNAFLSILEKIAVQWGE
jgi:hypothetical protein